MSAIAPTASIAFPLIPLRRKIGGRGSVGESSTPPTCHTGMKKGPEEPSCVMPDQAVIVTRSDGPDTNVFHCDRRTLFASGGCSVFAPTLMGISRTF